MIKKEKETSWYILTSENLNGIKTKDNKNIKDIKDESIDEESLETQDTQDGEYDWENM